MNFLSSEFLTTGGAFIIIFIFGFWLSRTGKPYSSALLNIHKLIGLGVGIYLIRKVVLINRAASLGTKPIIAIVVSVVFFLGLAVTGGLVSAEITVPGFVKTIHKILPYLAIISTGITLYLIL